MMEMFSLLLSVQITVKYCLQLFWCLYLDNNCYDLTEDESALVEHDKDDTAMVSYLAFRMFLKLPIMFLYLGSLTETSLDIQSGS